MFYSTLEGRNCIFIPIISSATFIEAKILSINTEHLSEGNGRLLKFIRVKVELKSITEKTGHTRSP
jgi:hypothetical protein